MSCACRVLIVNKIFVHADTVVIFYIGYDCVSVNDVLFLFMNMFSTCLDEHYLSVVVVNIDFKFMSFVRSILILFAVIVDISRLLLVDLCCVAGLC